MGRNLGYRRDLAKPSVPRDFPKAGPFDYVLQDGSLTVADEKVFRRHQDARIKGVLRWSSRHGWPLADAIDWKWVVKPEPR